MVGYDPRDLIEGEDYRVLSEAERAAHDAATTGRERRQILLVGWQRWIMTQDGQLWLQAARRRREDAVVREIGRRRMPGIV